MHGQKKRRKRFREGLIVVDGVRLNWKLVSEPQWTSEHGLRGLRISVRSEDGRHRELVLEFSFPNKGCGYRDLIPQLPQRPQLSEKAIVINVRRAMTAGWDPDSRGKTFILRAGESF
jgi:hypothetical protein